MLCIYVFFPYDLTPWIVCVLNRLYAFDVHCNAYFPLFISLYGKNTIHLKFVYKKDENILTLNYLCWILLMTEIVMQFYIIFCHRF